MNLSRMVVTTFVAIGLLGAPITAAERKPPKRPTEPFNRKAKGEEKKDDGKKDDGKKGGGGRDAPPAAVPVPPARPTWKPPGM